MSTLIEIGALVVVAAAAWFVLRRRGVGLARVAASTVGIYAGLLGAVHGYFEILQGNVAPDSFVINAIGTPCQADAVWHACLPAITMLPNFLIAGVLTLIISLIILTWAVAFIQRKRGGWILILLAVALLLAGGGFFPPFYGIVAGVIATQVKQ